ncbi:D-glycero-beta-D-manno-heptose-1,7-bisphosphate 7-phosphatase (EC 3.1.3.82) [Azospirillum argentinense]|uniref:HAD family hydrolase n=1 Tax=Azospirillum argentinense TaxID=2970906 RepID=UPI0032E0534A
MSMTCRALLLDRDGVVNIDHGYVGHRDQFEFVDGIFPLARHAVDRGFRIAVITNQSGIARGRYAEADFLNLSGWMGEVFRSHGVELAGVFHCPYHRDGVVERYARDSFWRKPNPGMILEAARRLDLALPASVFLGDQPTDMEAALAAGVGRRILLAEGSQTPARVSAQGSEGTAATLTLARPADLIPHLS